MSRYTDIDLENKKLPAVCGYWSVKLVSLEEALKPIEPLIEELDRSIRAAKKHCRFPSDHGLTKDESAAVYLYTMEGGENSFHLILNQALRSEDRPALRPWFSFLKLFDKAIGKLPTVKGNLWRGISGDVTGNFQKDQELTWWSISSCSTSLNVVKSFLGSDKDSTVFMIEAVNGKDITGYTNYPTENEVLLELGTQLRVKDDVLKHLGGLNIIHLVEIADDNTEPLPKTLAKMDLKPKLLEKATSETEQPTTSPALATPTKAASKEPTSGLGQPIKTVTSNKKVEPVQKISLPEAKQLTTTAASGLAGAPVVIVKSTGEFIIEKI